MIFQVRKPGLSQLSFHPRNAMSTLSPWWRCSFSRRLVVSHAVRAMPYAVDRDILNEDMRRHQDQALQTRKRLAACIDGCDGRPVGVSDQHVITALQLQQ